MSNETIITNKKRYYKILPEDLTCHGFKYQLGLNIDTNLFNDRECDNGLHFSNAKNVLYWLFMYNSTVKLKIATLYVPDEYEVIQFDSKCKSHAIYIEEIKDLLDKDTIDWMISIGNSINPLLPIAIGNSNIEIFKYLISKGVDVHYNDDIAMYRAYEYNRLDIVEYLYSLNTTYNVDYNEILYNACANGYLDQIKYLIENHNINIHICNDTPLYIAYEHDQLDVIKYLIDNSTVNVYKNYDSLCELAYKCCNKETIDYLELLKK